MEAIPQYWRTYEENLADPARGNRPDPFCPQGTAWVAGELGGTGWRTSTNLKDEIHYGLGVGHWYTDRWGLDLRLLQNDIQSSGPNAPSGKETHLLASGLFNFRPGADNWYPYLAAGVGATNLDAPYSEQTSSASSVQLPCWGRPHGQAGRAHFL